MAINIIKHILKKGADVYNSFFSDKGIYLITGCVRSGNTAVLKWLGQSKQVMALDEPRILFAVNAFLEKAYTDGALYENKAHIEDLLRQLIYMYRGRIFRRAGCGPLVGCKTLVCKEPLRQNAKNIIGNMRLLYPDIKIIFMMRHPVNVANSMTKRFWGSSMVAMKPYEMRLENAIEIWKFSANTYTENVFDGIYLCKFEELVRNAPAESAKIRRFLGINDIGDFQPAETRTLELGEADINRVLAETEKERRFFNYI